MAKGKYERSYDGLTWNEVKAQYVDDMLKVDFRDTRTVMRNMRERPGMEIKTRFAMYRYTVQAVQP